MPDPHAVHTRSVTVEPVVLMYVPAAHVVQLVQDGAFAVVLNEPEAHPEQLRFVVGDPATDTNCPAEHDDHATHAVDGSPSWSHVPLGHSTLRVSPPGQNHPATHGAHVGGVVDVAATV
jgi:hypothetical protein